MQKQQAGNNTNARRHRGASEWPLVLTVLAFAVVANCLWC